jgi:hypothetical protein
MGSRRIGPRYGREARAPGVPPDDIDDLGQPAGERGRIDGTSVADIAFERFSGRRERFCTDDARGAFYPMKRCRGGCELSLAQQRLDFRGAIGVLPREGAQELDQQRCVAAQSTAGAVDVEPGLRRRQRRCFGR